MKIAIVEDRPEDKECLLNLLKEDASGKGWTYAVEAYTSGEAFWMRQKILTSFFWML